jgi:DNA polymerase III subunit epsilon
MRRRTFCARRPRVRACLPPGCACWAGGQGDGYVLTLRDITGDMASEARREAMLETALDGLRRPAAAIATLVGVMPDDALPAPMAEALRIETARLSQAVTRFGEARDEGRGDAGVLPQTRASDLAKGFEARLSAAGIPVRVEAADLILRCNGFELIMLLAELAGQVAGRADGSLP